MVVQVQQVKELEELAVVAQQQTQDQEQLELQILVVEVVVPEPPVMLVEPVVQVW